MTQWGPIIKLVLATIVTGMMLGCAVTDEDRIGDSQFCLDDLPLASMSDVNERVSKVNGCLSKLGSVSTKQASLVRCAANFLIEGFGTPSKIVNALQQVSTQQGSGGGGTVGMMSILAFTSQTKSGQTATENATANANFAQETLNYCTQAGNPGYIWIASFSNMASALAKVGAAVGGVNVSDGISATEIDTILSSGSSAADDVIGATAIAAYQTSCSGADQTNQTLCTELGNAVTSGANSAAIGAALRAQWQQAH